MQGPTSAPRNGTSPAHRIMVAIDAGPPSLEAARYAISLAHLLGAETLFAAVIDEEATGKETAPREEIEEMLAMLIKEANGQAVVARSVLRHGHAVTTLLEIAASEEADLLICGTHGRRGLRRLVLGSVAEALARQASCPVLLVRRREETTQSL
jgi:nucleotide-binding universal stress UspA family protein